MRDTSTLPLQCHPIHSLHTAIWQGRDPLIYVFPRFLVQLTIMIIIIRLIHFLLKPLKQPRIVAEIIAAVIVGPSALGRCKSFSNTIFPKTGAIDIETIATVAMVYFLFVTGVKMDLAMTYKAGRKAVRTCLIGVLVPVTILIPLILLLRKKLYKPLVQPPAIGRLTTSLSVTGFPVMFPILKEVKMLNSNVGRLALSTAVTSDLGGWFAIILFQALHQATKHFWKGFMYMSSLIGLFSLIVAVVKPYSDYIIRKTPAGKSVTQSHVLTILLGVLVSALLSDAIGATIVDGPLLFGLMIPDGPPLGASLVEKTETIIMDLLMPILYAHIGQRIDIFSINEWSTLAPLLLVIVVGYVAKFVGNVLPSLYYNTPVSEAFSHGLIMSMRGQVEIITFLLWMKIGMINVQAFTLLVLCVCTVTAIVTPIAVIIHDSPKRSNLNHKRTIENLQPQKEFNIVACIHDQETIPAIVRLLEASNGSKRSPVVVHALHLVELVGRAMPMFLTHNKKQQLGNSASSSSASHAIIRALRIYEQTTTQLIRVHAYTSVAPYKTMYEDICRLALGKKASLIIVPFYTQRINALDPTKALNGRARRVNAGVLATAPCSVGILVDRGTHLKYVYHPLYYASHRVAVLFLGGPDARQVLAYANRMAGSVSLTVVRFLPAEVSANDEKEMKIDDKKINDFRVKNMKSGLVSYKEVTASTGVETVQVIRSMKDEIYDLWMVGRHHGAQSAFFQGLSDWLVNTELGMIGDIISSDDFGGTASVLVIQQ